RPAHIHRHDAIPYRGVDCGEVLLLERRVDCGVVDQDIDLAEAIERRGHERLHLLLVAHVEGHAGGGIAAGLGRKLVRERAAIGDIGNHHLGAFGRQRLGVVTADAPRATGDDGATAREPRHVYLPVCLRTSFSNASSCSLTMSLVAWSVSSSDFSSNFLAANVTNTSGRISTTHSIEVRHWRR